MRKILLSAAAAFMLAACSSFDPTTVPDATPDQVAHVEPLSWWVGMKLPLQLMVHGADISEYEVSVEGGNGVKVENVHKADSPNYLFVDVAISGSAAPGTYYIVFTKGDQSFKYAYEIEAREEGSAMRESFTTSDLIYLLMPDRFANGDPTNDSTDDTFEKADRSSLGGRHGGDIQGIIDHLDYIADLGATAIWTTPLLEDNDRRGSYHGYAASDYYHIDSRFGDNDLYKKMVDEAHERGIKIIMDMVPNHSGTTTYWWAEDHPFEDWLHHFPEYTGSNSVFYALVDPHHSQKDYHEMESGWFTRGMADMNLDNPYLLQYFKQWAIWWIEWAGLDGFRVDTYPYNEPKPMAEWNKAITDEYPNFNIVGEVWHGSSALCAYWQKDNNNHDGFNSYLPSVMDFPLKNAIDAAFSPREGRMRNVYETIAQDYLYKNLGNILIFPSNHDTDRAGDVVGKNPDRFKAMMTLYATLRGIPQIFSGDEMMFTSADPRTGHPGLRVDFPGGWEGDEFDLFTDEGRANIDVDFDGSPLEKGLRKEIFDYCKALFNWRKGADVIHNGQMLHFIPKGSGYGYFRYDDDEAVFVYVNNSSTRESKIPWADYAEFTGSLSDGKNPLTGEAVTISEETVVPPLGTVIVEYKRK